ncbi:MAG TPA: VOC family protein [Opitutaceae bacterium]|nr:VOC family protein [Opitutaceae bacterium]HND62595.1 VOC family protein [Opitutaceae bacterium]
MSAISGFHHVCVKTRDWDATMRLYQEVLGCTVKIAWRAAPQRAVMLDTGDGNYIEVFEDLAYSGPTNGAIYHFAFRTKELDATAARVRAAGFKITVEPRDVTIPTTNAGPVPVRIFFCEGPNGESIEFLQNTLT